MSRNGQATLVKVTTRQWWRRADLRERREPLGGVRVADERDRDRCPCGRRRRSPAEPARARTRGSRRRAGAPRRRGPRTSGGWTSLGSRTVDARGRRRVGGRGRRGRADGVDGDRRGRCGVGSTSPMARSSEPSEAVHREECLELLQLGGCLGDPRRRCPRSRRPGHRRVVERSMPSVDRRQPDSGMRPGTSSAAAANAPEATTTASTAVAPASTVRPGRRASVGNPVRNGSSTNRQLSQAAHDRARRRAAPAPRCGGSASSAISGRTSTGQCQR